MSNVKYSISVDGEIGYGQLPDGTIFSFDAEDFEKICDINWYRNTKGNKWPLYIADCKGNPIHRFIFQDVPEGCEVDHVNLNTLDNRKANLRICTHQQNQCNQPLQRNNTSGVAGVSYYPPRSKYRARIKASQHDIHLGYYQTFEEAVQARNVGMECMFGEYGRYNAVPDAPDWIRKQVMEKCMRFADLAVCRAHFSSRGGIHG